MSDERNVNVAVEVPEKKSRFGRFRGWLGEKISGETLTPEMVDTWNRIHRIGGFLPIFVEGHLEFRTKKMQDVLKEIEKDMRGCKNLDDILEVMFKSNVKVYNLFTLAGSQWIGGLHDREKARKVQSYLEFYQRCADNPSFAFDLYTCSTTMLNISWKPEDVGRLPPYLIETKTVIQPTEEKRLDMSDVQKL